MEGTVKWFSRDKGYGFIQGDDEKEYFVHKAALSQGTFIREHDKVSFEAAETERGMQAQNVVLLQKGSEMAQDEAPAEEEATEEVAEEEATEEATEE